MNITKPIAPDTLIVRIAREAAIPAHPGQEDYIRSGKADDWITVRSALRALEANNRQLQLFREALREVRTYVDERAGYSSSYREERLLAIIDKVLASIEGVGE